MVALFSNDHDGNVAPRHAHMKGDKKVPQKTYLFSLEINHVREF